jgi:hypothetical protein
VDSAWEQKKLEARKMLENAPESPASNAPKKIARDHFIREKRERKQKYTPKRRARKPYKAMESASCDSRGAPWFPVKLI